MSPYGIIDLHCLSSLIDQPMASEHSLGRASKPDQGIVQYAYLLDLYIMFNLKLGNF